jgi:hypothetical protein
MLPARRRQASGEKLGGSGGDLFVGVGVEGELVPLFTHEYGASGAPVLFGAEKDQLLSLRASRLAQILGRS